VAGGCCSRNPRSRIVSPGTPRRASGLRCEAGIFAPPTGEGVFALHHTRVRLRALGGDFALRGYCGYPPPTPPAPPVCGAFLHLPEVRIGSRARQSRLRRRPTIVFIRAASSS
jgi:hypothetical protein